MAENVAAPVASIGSLCSGYGGLDLGLALGLGVTLRHAWHVENDATPSKILATRFPGVPNYGDLKTLDYALMEPVDILTAGYPCQPFSDAGLRKGADDPRHLWPYVADAIGHLRPGLVFLENVRGHVRRGLDSVLADLASLGYDASWGVVRASDAGAPHRRERIFVVAADATDQRHERTGATRFGWAGPADQRHAPADTESRRRTAAPPDDGGALRARGRKEGCQPEARRSAFDAGYRGGESVAATDTATDTASDDGREAGARNSGVEWGAYAAAVARWEVATGRRAPRPTEPTARGERLSPRFVEWMMGLPAGWVTGVPGLSRTAQIKALGNGVVPQQAALALPLLLSNLAVRTEVAA